MPQVLAFVQSSQSSMTQRTAVIHQVVCYVLFKKKTYQ